MTKKITPEQPEEPKEPLQPEKEEPKDDKLEFTEEQQQVIDRTIVERGKRYAEKQIKELAAEFGIEDEDGLRAALKENDERKKAALSEQERLTAELEAEKTARAKAEAEAKSVRYENRVTAAASKLGFADPLDAIALVGDDVDDVEDALTKLAESKPYLLGKTKPPKLPAHKTGADADAEESDEERRRRLL